MRSRARAALGLAAAFVALASSAPAAAQVGVVIRDSVDREVSRQLQQLIEAPVEEHAVGDETVGLSAIQRQASKSWSAAYAVVIDRPNGAAHVLRLADRTAASRMLAPELMAESPYAVALAIAELLEWFGAVPPARPLEPAAPPVQGERSAEIDSDGREASYGLTAVVGADFEVTSSLGEEVNLMRPTLAGGLQWGRGQSSPWFGVGVRVAVPASTDRELTGSAPGAIARIRYASLDPAVTASLGIGAANASLVGELGLGLSILEVEGRSAAGARLARSDAVAPWLGLGLFLRYPLLWGLSLSVGAEGQWLIERGLYRVAGTPVLEEGRVRLATRLGVRWESGT